MRSLSALESAVHGHGAVEGGSLAAALPPEQAAQNLPRQGRTAPCGHPIKVGAHILFVSGAQVVSAPLCCPACNDG